MGFFGKAASIFKSAGGLIADVAETRTARTALGAVRQLAPLLPAPLNWIGEIDDLVDVAEKLMPGSGRGAEKKAWVMNMIRPILEHLDKTPEAEFGIKDNAAAFAAVEGLIDNYVKLRNATTWFGVQAPATPPSELGL